MSKVQQRGSIEPREYQVGGVSSRESIETGEYWVHPAFRMHAHPLALKNGCKHDFFLTEWADFVLKVVFIWITKLIPSYYHYFVSCWHICNLFSKQVDEHSSGKWDFAHSTLLIVWRLSLSRYVGIWSAQARICQSKKISPGFRFWPKVTFFPPFWVIIHTIWWLVTSLWWCIAHKNFSLNKNVGPWRSQFERGELKLRACVIDV